MSNVRMSFGNAELVQVGDQIDLHEAGLSITVTERIPPLFKGGEIVQRSVIGKVDEGSASHYGFEPGTLCLLMVEANSKLTVVPLEVLVYGLKDRPPLSFVR